MIQILYLSCWVQTTRYQKPNTLGIRIGKRAITLVKNYYPNTKIYIFDTISPNQLPTIQLTYNDSISRTYDLGKFLSHDTEPFVDIINDVRVLFTVELFHNTQKINEKYCHEKSDIQKHYLCEGIKDYIRSEQEFLAQFERNQEIQQIRQLQAEQSRIEKDLCDEIMNTQKYTLSIGKITLILLVFLFVGFLIGKHQEPSKTHSLTNLFYPHKNHKHKLSVKNKKNIFKTKNKKDHQETNKPRKTPKSQRNRQS